MIRGLFSNKLYQMVSSPSLYRKVMFSPTTPLEHVEAFWPRLTPKESLDFASDLLNPFVSKIDPV